MEDPTDGVVDEFRLWEGLVTTFVSDDPQTGCKQPSNETIHCPEGDPGSSVKARVRQIQKFRGYELFGISRSVVCESNSNRIPHTVNVGGSLVCHTGGFLGDNVHVSTRLERRTTETMSTKVMIISRRETITRQQCQLTEWLRGGLLQWGRERGTWTVQRRWPRVRGRWTWRETWCMIRTYQPNEWEERKKTRNTRWNSPQKFFSA